MHSPCPRSCAEYDNSGDAVLGRRGAGAGNPHVSAKHGAPADLTANVAAAGPAPRTQARPQALTVFCKGGGSEKLPERARPAKLLARIIVADVTVNT